jgi:uncharacterized protein
MIAGFGIGLRRAYAGELLNTKRPIDFLEITPENWLFHGGQRERILQEVLARWPAVSHSVSLSVGGLDPFDEPLLAALHELHAKTDAPFFSDHLCWSSHGGRPLHDLLPLPFTEEAVEHVSQRIAELQTRARRPFVIENATFYALLPQSRLSEAEFVRAVLDRSGCGMLLDVNNVFVNSKNHGTDPRAFIDAMPLDKVRQIHVAGHTLEDELIIDTHIGPVIDDVWSLYRYTLQRAGRLIPTLVEWDQEIPPLDTVLDELDRARKEASAAL